MELQDILMLKENLELLANGKDPKTGYDLNDSVLQSSFNKKVLTDAASLIDKLLKLDFNPTRIDRRKKYAFFLTPEQRLQIDVSKEAVSISSFVYTINEIINETKMRKLKATQITSWLLKEGFLKEVVHSDGRKFKIPTDKASQIGIFSIQKKSEFGRVYDVCMYDENAQQYIINHFDDILANTTKVL